MARSNPFIRKPRQPNQTVLAVGEGETEWAFLSYLKSVYIKRESGLFVKAEYAHGGGPECVITHAVKLNPRIYTRSFVLLDKDLPCRPSYIRKAREKKLELIWSDPCVEGLLLRILESDFSPAARQTQECKKLFEDKYLNGDEKLRPEKYANLFPLVVLEDRRRQVPELARMIALLTGK